MFNISILPLSRTSIQNVFPRNSLSECQKNILTEQIQPIINVANDIEQATLKPTQVRWFYKNITTKKWIPFNGFDSINIEFVYLKLVELKAERSPAVEITPQSPELLQALKPLLVRDGLYEVKVLDRICYPVYWEAPEGPTVILRGTWFRDPGGPQCVPIEDEDMAEKLEITHLQLLPKFEQAQETRSVSPASDLDGEITQNTYSSNDKEKSSSLTALFSSTPKTPCVHTLHLLDSHVDWHSADEIFLYNETATFYIRQTLRMQKVGTRLGRGYYEEATLTDQPPSVAHLVLVVHGMGQKFLKGSIVQSCKEIRATSNKLIESYFPDIEASGKRVEFLPVEWRTSLRLDGDIVDSITLENLSRLRYFLNSTFMDIMYYTSPLYRFDISRSLLMELNRVYGLFRDRHPTFETNNGKVSILAHSLGCVISYDLITGWVEPVGGLSEQVARIPTTVLDLPINEDALEANGEVTDVTILSAKVEAAKEVVKCLEYQLKMETEHETERNGNSSTPDRTDSFTYGRSLAFASRLENLYCVGSPLGVYLTLRGVRPGQTSCPDKVMPRSLCRHIYNVFHPADPVAYRLEPLILKHYSSIPPMDIFRCGDASKTPYHILHINSLSPKNGIPTQHSAPAHICNSFDRSGHTSPVPDEIENGTDVENQNIGSGMRRKLSLTNFLGLFWNQTEGAAQNKFTEQPSRSGSSASSKRLRPSEDEEVDQNGKEKKSMEAGPSTSPVASPDLIAQFFTFENRGELSNESSFGDDIEIVEKEEEELVLKYRMDYRLRESRYESAYLSAMTVHTSYWSNPDVVMFILMQTFNKSTPIDCPLTPLW